MMIANGHSKGDVRMDSSHGAKPDSEPVVPKTIETEHKGRRRHPKPTSHTWTRSSVILVGKKKASGRHRPSQHPLDLRPFRLNAHSLLHQVLRAIPVGEHSVYLSSFCQTIVELKDKPETKEILRASPDQLSTWDIRELYISIEDVISKWPKNSQYDRALAVRAIFARHQGRLKDDSQVSECIFSSRFFAGKKGHKLNQTTDEEYALPKLLDDFDTLQERNSKALRDSIDKQEHILEACEITISEHERAKDIVLEARNAGLPEMNKRTGNSVRRGGIPDSSTFRKWSESDRLRVIVYLLDKGALGGMPFRTLNQFNGLLDSDSAPRRYELLISDKFLPRFVVIAHGITILTLTALNPDVLYTLTKHNIYRQGEHRILTGLKGRVDGKVEVVLNESDDPTKGDIKVSDQRVITALDELVANASAIESAFQLKDVPLVCGLDYTAGTASFYTFHFYREARRFWKWHGREPIDLRSLRPLAARAEFLSPGGSLYTVQALLNHKNKNTTIEYVNNHVIAELFEANIRRFMRKLEATALFRLNRKNELAERGLTEHDIQKPLFPVVESLSAKTIVDDWVAQNGDIKIEIGIAELTHCARQLKYYKRSYPRLITDNPSRFVEVHFPRMLFCVAMKEIAKNSPHWAIYRKIERELT